MVNQLSGTGRVEGLADLLESSRRDAPWLVPPGTNTERLARSPHIAGFAGRDRSTTNIAAQVVALADLWTLIAGEQIGALAHVVRNRDVFAIFPLLRSALEHSCYVVWLLDPDLSINPGARCVRWALAVDRSNEEMATAVAHLRGRGSQAHHEYREALRRFRDEVRAAFPNEVEIDEQLTIAGERFPRPTDVIRQFGARWGEADEAEGVYDYLCTTATHPTLAALEWLAPVEGGGVVIDVSMEALTADAPGRARSLPEGRRALCGVLRLRRRRARCGRAPLR